MKRVFALRKKVLAFKEKLYLISGSSAQVFPLYSNPRKFYSLGAHYNRKINLITHTRGGSLVML